MYTIGTDGGTDDGVSAALARQEALLASLVRRFEQSRQAYRPVSLQDEWHGVAQHFYARSLGGLLADLDAVSDCLDSALAHTRSALDTVTRPAG